MADAAAGGGGGAGAGGGAAGGGGGANNAFRYLDYGSTRGSEVTYLFLADGKRIFKPDHPLPNYDPTNENLAEPNYYQNDYNPAFIAAFIEIFNGYDPTFEVIRNEDADNEEGYGWSEYSLVIRFPNDKESLSVIFDKSIPTIEIFYNDSNGEVRVTFMNFYEGMIPTFGRMIEDVYDATPEEVGPGPEPSNLAAMMAATLQRPRNPSSIFRNIERQAKRREALNYNTFLNRVYNTSLPTGPVLPEPIRRKNILNLPSNTLKTVKDFLVKKGGRRSTRRRRNTNKKASSKKRKQTRRRA
jgi:hypothetical protein